MRNAKWRKWRDLRRDRNCELRQLNCRLLENSEMVVARLWKWHERLKIGWAKLLPALQEKILWARNLFPLGRMRITLKKIWRELGPLTWVLVSQSQYLCILWWGIPRKSLAPHLLSLWKSLPVSKLAYECKASCSLMYCIILKLK